MGSRISNTLVVMPSYNEARTIGGLVANIVNMGLSVLVIDDGSTDDTERTALDNGAIVVRHKHNLGKGASVRQGIKYAEEKMNFEWMILMDGDGQHHSDDILALMNAVRNDEADIVMGNRMGAADNMPLVRLLTNKFMSFVISLMCRQPIPDSQCGFRLVRVSILKNLDLVSDGFDIESEMLIQAAEDGKKIISAPVRTIYGEETSHIRPLHDTIRFFNLIIRHSFGFSGLRRKKKNNGR